MPNVYKNFIDGEWTESTSGKTFANINPADTGDVVGLFQQSTEEDVNQAFEAAAEAQKGWAATAPPDRGRVLARMARLFEERSKELAAILCREEGKTFAEARMEALGAARQFQFYAGEAERLTGDSIPSGRPNVFIHTRRKPLGCVSIITPWNFPIAIPVWKTAPALVCGNSVVFKPSSLAPLTTLKMAEMFEEARLPKGVFNYLTGSGGRVGNPMVTHPKCRGVSFTGSCAIGTAINKIAADSLVRTQLEMGGKNPHIILGDADMNVAVNATLQSAFGVSGQRCTAASRIIIEESVHDQFVDQLVEKTKTWKVGNGMAEDVKVGPLVDENQMNIVIGYIETGKKEGAELVFGGARLTDGDYANGFFVEPAIFTNVTNDMTIAREEIFGPVVGIIKVGSMEEAIDVANDTEFGLSASLCTTNLKKAFTYINSIEVGVAQVNLPSAGIEWFVPFGGSKASGFGGKEQGSTAVDFFSELQTVYLQY